MTAARSRRGCSRCSAIPLVVVFSILAAVAAVAQTPAPIRYRFTFPEPQHHWMQVEATFADLDETPLELRMSRSSPGRYSLHDFAKNVYDVQATSADGTALRLARPDPYGWTIAAHSKTLTVRYKVFGDRVDGTYLAIDTTHAHINMPAALMWARGLDHRAAHLAFVPPPGNGWRAATQLFAGTTPFEFTAPNLQYLMDSPIELGPIVLRTFEVDGRTFRFSAHHEGSDGELDAFVRDVRKIVEEERKIYGQYPAYEPGSYTFLADYLPYASGDGMEHRNSTVITSPASIESGRAGLLNTVAHEFFHGWNVERIRPRSLEPFDFERANLSSELWLAEGFTQYYAPVVLSRARIEAPAATLASLAGLVRSIALSPGRLERSAEEMSQMAPFTDGGRTIDRTNWSNTYISYYPYGGAVALALDLSIREKSNGQRSLDHFMRAMWQRYGAPGGAQPGRVDHPYTLADAEQELATLTGDARFAGEFFARYVHGRELPDYPRLLALAGLTIRKQAPGRAWWGDLQLEVRGGLRVATTPASNTPAYRAGLDIDDELKTIDGHAVANAEQAVNIVQSHKPGDQIAVTFVDRSRIARTVHVALEEDPAFDIVMLEATGGTPTDAQRRFRDNWLN